MNKINQLFEHLKSSRSRFGIWCCDLSELGNEPNLAVQLGAEAVDLATVYRESLDPDANYLGLDDQKLTDLISAIARKQGKVNVMVYNADLLLSKLAPAQRKNFWNILLNGLIYLPRSLVLMIPQAANNQYPPDEDLKIWQEKQRIIFSE